MGYIRGLSAVFFLDANTAPRDLGAAIPSFQRPFGVNPIARHFHPPDA